MVDFILSTSSQTMNEHRREIIIVKSLTYLRTKYQYEKHEKEFNFNGNCRIDDFILQ